MGPRLSKREILDWANSLPDDAIILSQVIGQENSGAWSMHIMLSEELAHFKWEGPVYCITMHHPNLLSVNPDVKWGAE